MSYWFVPPCLERFDNFFSPTTIPLPDQASTTGQVDSSFYAPLNWSTWHLSDNNAAPLRQEHFPSNETNMTKTICEQCGKEFEKPERDARQSNHHFCSRDCYYLWQNKRISVTCATCGKKVQKRPSQVAQYKHHYCSPKCQAIGRRTQLVVACDQCGKEFLRKPSRIARQKHHCTHCGNPITRHPSILKRVQNPFCSQECFRAWLKEHPPSGERFREYNLTVKKGHSWEEIYGPRKAAELRKHYSKILSGKGNPNFGNHVLAGKNNPNWKGGICREPYGFEFDEKLKELIRERDDHKCQLCGMSQEDHIKISSHRLSIHHIDYNKTNNDESNLISLCKTCHSATNYNREYYQQLLTSYTERISMPQSALE